MAKVTERLTDESIRPLAVLYLVVFVDVTVVQVRDGIGLQHPASQSCWVLP